MKVPRFVNVPLGNVSRLFVASGHQKTGYIRNPSVVLTKPSGLDPKRAKAFNRPVVERYLDELLRLVEKHGIPIENIYNMDEKGCQRGGGKKGTSRKYFYSRRARAKYKHRSGNLELVTIVEAICKGPKGQANSLSMYNPRTDGNDQGGDPLSPPCLYILHR